MGLEGDTTDTIRDELAAPAWIEQRIGCDPGRSLVVWSDYLTRFKELNNDAMHSIESLVDHFMRTVERWLFNAFLPVLAFIVSCDDRTYVTHWKKREQATRAHKSPRHVEAYTDDDPLDPSAIDLLRFKKTDPTDKWLWRVMLPLIARRMAKRCPRDGRVLVFDFDQTLGPVVIRADGTYTVERNNKHQLGEADPAAIWWMERFAPHRSDIDYHLLTTDSDLIPLYLFYHEWAVRRDQRVFWHTPRRPGVMADFRRMAELIHVRVALPRTWFAGVFCIVSGTDFWKRSVLVGGFGARRLLDIVVGAYSAYVYGINAPADETTEAFVEWLLRHVWLTMVPGKVHVPERFRKPDPPLLSWSRLCELLEGERARFPGRVICPIECKRYAFNLHYWRDARLGRVPQIE